MDRGEPAKAQQGPGLGRSETHSEARTGQRATFQRRRVPGSQSPRLKRQVLCGPGDGPGSPAPPRGPAWSARGNTWAWAHFLERRRTTTNLLLGAFGRVRAGRMCQKGSARLRLPPVLQRLLWLPHWALRESVSGRTNVSSLTSSVLRALTARLPRELPGLPALGPQRAGA